MYKGIIILYFACFFCYLLFSRVPDYFEGEYIRGVVTEAGFSETEREPILVIRYRVGKEAFLYKTNQWLLSKYKKGDEITVIYDPSNPINGSIYAVVGYWIKWQEFLFTAGFFVLLFGGAAAITGKNSNLPSKDDELKNKRKYDE